MYISGVVYWFRSHTFTESLSFPVIGTGTLFHLFAWWRDSNKDGELGSDILFSK